MSEADRHHWDTRYGETPDPTLDDATCPRHFTSFEDAFPSSGLALDLACGAGTHSVWMALRGLDVDAVDISAVAIAHARNLADAAGVSARCHFAVADLDDGLPPGPAVDVLLCHLYRQPSLYGPMIDRVRPGGVVGITVLSEVDGHPGRFRAPAGELLTAFTALDVLTAGESGGEAWLLGRRRIDA